MFVLATFAAACAPRLAPPGPGPTAPSLAPGRLIAADGLEHLMKGRPETFEAVDTAAADVVLIAFTSGTTGKSKATVHFHRDVMVICDAFPRSILKPGAAAVFCGSTPTPASRCTAR